MKNAYKYEIEIVHRAILTVRAESQDEADSIAYNFDDCDKNSPDTGLDFIETFQSECSSVD